MKTAKKLLWLLIPLTAFVVAMVPPLSAQPLNPLARTVNNGTADPAVCNPTAINIFLNRTTPAFKICTAANTWSSLVVSGGAGGWPMLAPNGTLAAPSYAFASEPGTGWYFGATADMRWTTLGTGRMQLAGSILGLRSDGTYAWSSGIIGAGNDTFLTRFAAATVQQGAADAASQPVAQTRKVQRASGGTNTASSAETRACGGSGTGNATGAQCIWQLGTPQASGTTPHVMGTALLGQDFGLSNVQRATIKNSAGVMLEPTGNTFFVTSDFTTASTTFVTVTGLSWTMPANHAMNVPFNCELQYSQATAVVANQFGIQDVTVAPTNLMANAHVYTSATVFVAGATNALATTTATALVTFTPSVITNSFTAHIAGFIEQPSNAAESVINILVLSGNAADSLTVKRGSRCTVGF